MQLRFLTLVLTSATASLAAGATAAQSVPAKDLVSDTVFPVLSSLARYIEPYRTPALALGALFLLASVLGGGFKIKEFEMVKIGVPTRVLAGLFGCMIIIVAIIPGVGASLTGKIALPSTAVSTSNLGVRIIPTESIVDTGLVDGELIFEVPGLKSGAPYEIELLRGHDVIFTTTVFVEDDKVISIVQHADQSFHYTDKDLLTWIFGQYVTDATWQNRNWLTKMLAGLLGSDPSDGVVHEFVLKKLQNPGIPDEAVLALFALSEHCWNWNEQINDGLLSYTDIRAKNPFRRVKAMANIARCDETSKDQMIRGLLEIISEKSDLLVNTDWRQITGLKRQAAYYLAKLEERKRCVIDTLLQGLGSKENYVQRLAYEGLAQLTRVADIGLEPIAWRRWWADRSGDYDPLCE